MSSTPPSGSGPHIAIGVGVSDQGVDAGVGAIKKSLSSIADAGVSAGKGASKGIDAIGDSAVNNAKKLESEAAKIERTVQAINNRIAIKAKEARFGVDSPQVFEERAIQRGVPTSAIKPALADLEAANAVKASRELQAANDALAAKQAILSQRLKDGAIKFNEYGISAKQTAAAMRQVPAQFTDIIVSLQGGQAPLTVLLQQGGQLKDVFGGVGPAFKALAGYVTGLLINPITIAAGAVAALGYSFIKTREETEEYAKALILTGNAAGTTIGQLQRMAKSVSSVVGTQGDAAEALAAISASGQVASENLEKFALSAVRMERVTGQSVADTVKVLSELGRSPVEASIRLNETTGYLTASVLQQIRAFAENGDAVKAASLAQQAYVNDIDPKLAQLENRLTSIGKLWKFIKDAPGNTAGFLGGLLEKDETDASIDKFEKRLQTLKNIKANGSNVLFPPKIGDIESFNLDKSIANYESLIGKLKETQALGAKVATGQQESRAASKKAAEDDDYLSKFNKGRKTVDNMNAALDKYDKTIERLSKNPDYKLPTLAEQKIDKDKIRKEFTETPKKNNAEQIERAQAALNLAETERIRSREITQLDVAQNIIEAMHSAGLISDKIYYEEKNNALRESAELQQKYINQEIELEEARNLKGEKAIERQKKVVELKTKLDKIQQDLSGKQVVSGIGEDSAARREEQSYKQARQAAIEYFEEVNKQQNREIKGVGAGDQARNLDRGISQIEDKYSAQRRTLQNNRELLEMTKAFDEKQEATYKRNLDLINEFQDKSISSYRAYYATLRGLEKDASLGAKEALKNYADTASNTFKLTNDLVSNSLKNMEDSLANFVKTGKLDFQGLVQSILDGIVKIIIQQQLIKPIANYLQGGSGGEGFASIIGKLFGGGSGGMTFGEGQYAKGGIFDNRVEKFASGGSFTNQIVNSPTMFNKAQMGEAGPEAIIPLKRAPNGSLGVTLAGGGMAPSNTTVFNVHVTAPQGTSRQSAMQWGAEAGRQMNRAVSRNT